MPGTKPNADIG
jgi:tubulin--tyrosine ligase